MENIQVNRRMPNERRITEASSFRELFQEQWSSLLDLLEERSARQEAGRRQEQMLSAAIDDVVDKTDARIRAISSYQKTLRQSMHALLEHVEGLVASLPQAQLINQKSFISAHNINRFFVNAREMQEIFSRSRDLQEFFLKRQLEEAYLLLFLYKHEKSTLGVGLENNFLVRDQHQTSVNFSGHRVMATSADESELRSALKRILFERITVYIRSELSGELGLAKQHPQLSLDRLCRAMSRPRELVCIQQNTLQVDRLGILQDAESADAENVIQLNELEIAKTPREIVLLGRYPRSEMLSADELQQMAGPYLG